MPIIKLSEQDKKAIIDRASNGEKLIALSEAFDVSVQYIRRIVSEARKGEALSLPWKTKQYIAGEILAGETSDNLAEEFGISAQGVRQIVEEVNNETDEQFYAGTVAEEKERGIIMPEKLDMNALRAWAVSVYESIGQYKDSAEYAAKQKDSFSKMSDDELWVQSGYTTALLDAFCFVRRQKTDFSDLL